MSITFIEPKAFLRKVEKHWDLNVYQEFKIDLADNPDLGTVLKHGKGIRKIRYRASGRGKSGGVRVIYFWAVGRDIIVMLDLFTKGEKDNLTDRELKALVDLKREILGE